MGSLGQFGRCGLGRMVDRSGLGSGVVRSGSGAASVFERGADDFAVDGFGGIDGNEFQEGGDDVDGVCGFDSRALSESGSAKEEDGILFGKSAMLSAFFSCPAHGVTWHGTDDEISGTIIVAPE